MKLQDKVAVVTGGGTGMGRAICELFAAEGAGVIVNYSVSKDAAEETAAAIQSAGGKAFAMRADVALDADARALMAQAIERFGRIDYLINNAGWSKRTPHNQLDDLTDDIWDRTLNVNLRGPFYCMRAAAELLKKNAGSSIVNVASIAPYLGEGSTIVYAASKAGLISMTKSFARVLAPDVRVNAIAPGFVKTRFAGWPDEAFRAGAEASPLKRIATVNEIATATFFLAVEATAMTGETVRVDSGVVALRHA